MLCSDTYTTTAALSRRRIFLIGNIRGFPWRALSGFVLKISDEIQPGAVLVAGQRPGG
jgi:hypothetical protein